MRRLFSVSTKKLKIKGLCIFTISQLDSIKSNLEIFFILIENW